MTKKFEMWMPLLVDKYLGDTTHLTTEQHGAYLLLLMSMWKKDGRLVDNDQQLAQMAKLSPPKWRAARPVLIDGLLLRSEDGFVTQKRLARELTRSKAHTDAKAEAGAKGAAKRWGKGGNPNDSANAEANGTAIADASGSQSQTGAHRHSHITPPTTTEPAVPVVQDEGLGGQGQGKEPAGLRGEVGKALKRAGVPPTSFNLDDPRLGALLAQGATPAEFEGLAKEAVAKGIRKPWGWVLAVLPERRTDAAAIRLAPQDASRQDADPMAWTKSRSAVIDRANRLGIGPWSEVDAYTGHGPTWERYRAEVIAASERQQQGVTT